MRERGDGSERAIDADKRAQAEVFEEKDDRDRKD